MHVWLVCSTPIQCSRSTFHIQGDFGQSPCLVRTSRLIVPPSPQITILLPSSPSCPFRNRQSRRFKHLATSIACLASPTAFDRSHTLRGPRRRGPETPARRDTPPPPRPAGGEDVERGSRSRFSSPRCKGDRAPSWLERRTGAR